MRSPTATGRNPPPRRPPMGPMTLGPTSSRVTNMAKAPPTRRTTPMSTRFITTATSITKPAPGATITKTVGASIRSISGRNRMVLTPKDPIPPAGPGATPCTFGRGMAGPTMSIATTSSPSSTRPVPIATPGRNIRPPTATSLAIPKTSGAARRSSSLKIAIKATSPAPFSTWPRAITTIPKATPRRLTGITRTSFF